MLTRIRADASPWTHRLFAILAAASLLTGCAGRPLMPTPDLYTVGGTPAFGDLPAELESNRVDILYVTDRKPE